MRNRIFYTLLLLFSFSNEKDAVYAARKKRGKKSVVHKGKKRRSGNLRMRSKTKGPRGEVMRPGVVEKAGFDKRASSWASAHPDVGNPVPSSVHQKKEVSQQESKNGSIKIDPPTGQKPANKGTQPTVDANKGPGVSTGNSVKLDGMQKNMKEPDNRSWVNYLTGGLIGSDGKEKDPLIKVLSQL